MHARLNSFVPDLEHQRYPPGRTYKKSQRHTVPNLDQHPLYRALDHPRAHPEARRSWHQCRRCCSPGAFKRRERRLYFKSVRATVTRAARGGELEQAARALVTVCVHFRWRGLDGGRGRRRRARGWVEELGAVRCEERGVDCVQKPEGLPHRDRGWVSPKEGECAE